MGEGPSGTGSWGKYLEIANFTGAIVSLSGYLLGKTTNGGDAYESYGTFADGAEIANGDVYVIGRATSSDADAPADLVDNIDEVNDFISHNGDDAYDHASFDCHFKIMGYLKREHNWNIPVNDKNITDQPGPAATQKSATRWCFPCCCAARGVPRCEK